jgi:hypothetical protein
MLLPLLGVEVKGRKAVAKVGAVAQKGVGCPQGPPLIWASLAFLHFSLCLEAPAILAIITLHASSRWGFSHMS